MSLSILLDYDPNDTKRHSFEVSLFAELFNEMMMRDFGFNIYTCISRLAATTTTTATETSDDPKQKRDDAHLKPDTEEPVQKKPRKSSESGESSRTSKRSDSSKRSEADSKSESKDKDKSSSSTTSGTSRDKEKRDRDRRPSRREEEADDETKRRETRKMVTVDPALLLSFVYFDHGHCGYIFSNHLDELFHAMDLKLSRGDSKKLINRVAPTSLFYR